MRILHAISGIDPQNGGPTAALVGLCAAQAAAGLDVTVASTWKIDEAFETARRLEAAGVKLRMIGRAHGQGSRHRSLVPTLQDALAQCDVLHVHAMWEQIQYDAERLARAIGRPYVIRPCGMLGPWSLAQSPMKKRLYLRWRLRRNLNGAAALHFTTAMERDLAAPLGLPPRPIVEPNGVDPEEFAQLPPRGSFRAQHARIGQRPMVLFLGRLSRQKGLDLLIPAFAKIAGDAVLVIAGPDSDRYGAQVAAMIAAHGLAERVVLTGMLPGAQRLAAMADADLFVLPSYQENFGIAVVEALAAGTPVIVSDQVNIHAEISAAGVGAVVPTQAEPLAREMVRWLGDASWRAAAAAKARPFVWDRYDWKQIAQRWVGHYRKLVDQGSANAVGAGRR